MRKLALVACLLTVCITAASALIRHWQGGLDCQRWTACHERVGKAPTAAGQPGVGDPQSEPPAVIGATRTLHRVSATAVGLLVVGLAIFGWNGFGTSRRIAAVVALVDTVFLSWLGRYTPHDLPLVTIGNLGGGFLLVGALAWIATAGGNRRGVASRGLAVSALAMLAVLAWFGVMIGGRSAIGVCTDPLCLAGAVFDAAAFDPWLPFSSAASAASGQALHLAHRAAAVLFAIIVVMLALRIARAADHRGNGRFIAASLLVLLVAQSLLGYATAIGTLPLISATLHNIGAALLVASLTAAATLDRSTGD